MNEKYQIEKNKVISQNFKFILQKEKEKDEKLKLIKIFATFYWANVTGKYRDYYLEEELNKIGKTMFKSSDIVNIESKNKKILHIITEVYEIGGHTRLLNNWIKFDEDKIGDVLVVNPNKSKIPQWFKGSIKEKNGDIFLLQNCDINLKVKEMINILKNYSEIILHIHPNDIITCLALSSLRNNQKVYFVNHADHKFSLGYNYSNCVLELSEDGKNMGKLKRQIKFSEVLPIPIDNEKGESDKDDIILEPRLNKEILVSMASEYKYFPTKKYNFQNFLDKLLESNQNIVFNIIGSSEKNKIWKPLKKKYNNRLNLLGILPKEKTQSILKESTIYVDSFPFASYTSILEAINLDVQAVSLKTEVADLDSLKLIKENNIDELVLKINELLDNKENKKICLLKKKIKDDHYKIGWQKKLREIRRKEYTNKNFLKQDVEYFMEDYEKLFIELSKKRLFKFSFNQFFKLKLKNQLKLFVINFKRIK